MMGFMQISIDPAFKKSRWVFKRGICGNQTLAWEDAALMLVTGCVSSGKMVAMVIRNQPDHSAARSSATKLELPPSPTHHHQHCVQAG